MSKNKKKNDKFLSFYSEDDDTPKKLFENPKQRKLVDAFIVSQLKTLKNESEEKEHKQLETVFDTLIKTLSSS